MGRKSLIGLLALSSVAWASPYVVYATDDNAILDEPEMNLLDGPAANAIPSSETNVIPNPEASVIPNPEASVIPDSKESAIPDFQDNAIQDSEGNAASQPEDNTVSQPQGNAVKENRVTVFNETNFNLKSVMEDNENYLFTTASNATHLFQQSCPEEALDDGTHALKLSSYARGNETEFFASHSIQPSTSLGRAAIAAWALHQDLKLRPDDVWNEIVGQLGLYLLTEPGETEKWFTCPTRKALEIQPEAWNDAKKFEKIVWKRLTTLRAKESANWFQDWISPKFSTSKPQDRLTAIALLFGRVQTEHQEPQQLDKCKVEGSSKRPEQGSCGWHSVTLLGKKSDWERLLSKLDPLEKNWGEEAKEYASNLRPILKKFVKTWDDPKAKTVQEFWSQMIVPKFTCVTRYDRYDQQPVITGWLSGFYFWDRYGKLDGSEDGVQLGGITYKARGVFDLPVNYATLQMKSKGDKGQGKTYTLVAGNIGVIREKLPNDSGVSAKPSSGWIVYGPSKKGHPEAPKTERELNFLRYYVSKCWNTERDGSYIPFGPPW